MFSNSHRSLHNPANPLFLQPCLQAPKINLIRSHLVNHPFHKTKARVLHFHLMHNQQLHLLPLPIELNPYHLTQHPHQANLRFPKSQGKHLIIVILILPLLTTTQTTGPSTPSLSLLPHPKRQNSRSTLRSSTSFVPMHGGPTLTRARPPPLRGLFVVSAQNH